MREWLEEIAPRNYADSTTDDEDENETDDSDLTTALQNTSLNGNLAGPS